jgi:flagellar biosynthetic protein FliR
MVLSAGVLFAFGLVLARTAALIVAAPLLGFGTGFAGYRLALVFLLSVTLFVAHDPLPVEVEPIAYAVLLLREVVIGVFLGFLLQLVLLAVRVGGEMVGQEMGFLVARQVDPQGGAPSSIVSNMYEILFLLALLAVDGHHWLMRALDDSLTRAPIGELSLGLGFAPALQTMLGEMFAAGVVFAAPVLVILVMTSILIGLLARAVPTLNVLEIGFSLRVVVALVAMYLFAPLLEPSMMRLHEAFTTWLSRGLDALG